MPGEPPMTAMPASAGEAAEPQPTGESQAQDQARDREAQAVLDLAQGIARRLDQLREAQARAVGLRPPALALVSVLAPAGEEGLTVGQAAELLAVRPQALAPVTAELEGEGLITRVADPVDRRARRLALTPAGRERLDLCGELAGRMVEELLKRVPSPIVARLVLGKLDAALAAALDGGE